MKGWQVLTRNYKGFSLLMNRDTSTSFIPKGSKLKQVRVRIIHRILYDKTW
jgi:hypothetical protein